MKFATKQQHVMPRENLSIPSTVNPLLNLTGGLFIWNIFEGEGVGLVETGGLFERGGGLNLAKTMASVLYKELQ